MEEVKDLKIQNPDKVLKALKSYHRWFNRVCENVHPMDIVERLYRFIDVYANDCVKAGVSCKRGCNHCCRIPVDVSIFEANYIVHKRPELKELGSEDNFHQLTKEAMTNFCPFNDKNGDCTIWDIRPIHCRTFFSLDDPELCKDANGPHNMITVRSQSQVHKEYMKLIMMGRDALKRGHGIDISDEELMRHGAPKPLMADIREWFGEGRDYQPKR